MTEFANNNQPDNFISIDAEALNGAMANFTIIDVRKEPAFQPSRSMIAGACWRKPFAAENWYNDLAGKSVVVYCVHGHEVSQAVSGFLRDKGLDARFLEGGFESWLEKGFPTVDRQASKGDAQ